MDSKTSGNWSIGEAEATILAFLLTADTNKRYTDIQRGIESTGREISPRTLTKALDSLVAKGVLKKEECGKERWYDIGKLPTSMKNEAMVKADKMFLDAVSKIGIDYDDDKVWTIYGLSKDTPKRVRNAMTKETKKFREKMFEILYVEGERIIDFGLTKWEKGVSAKEKKRTEDSLYFLLEITLVMGLGLKMGFAQLGYVDSLLPGTGATVLRRLEKEMQPYPEGTIQFISRMTKTPADELKKSREQAMKHWEVIESFLASLRENHRKDFEDRFLELGRTCNTWCAVVR